MERMFVTVCKGLAERPVVEGAEIDAWFANRTKAAAVPAKFQDVVIGGR